MALLSTLTLLVQCALAADGSWQLDETQMGTTYEPDGYELTVGTWGTDCDFETSSSALSADGYWEFKATTPAADTVLRYKDYIPVNETQPNGHHAWAYA